MTGIIAALSSVASGDTQTVTVGSAAEGGGGTARGFVASSYGSISDGTSNIYSGAPITGLFYSEDDGAVYFRLSTAGLPNSGWTTMRINGAPFDRASAFSFSNSGQTQWQWLTSNPFGTTNGVNIPVAWG